MLGELRMAPAARRRAGRAAGEQGRCSPTSSARFAQLAVDATDAGGAGSESARGRSRRRRSPWTRERAWTIGGDAMGIRKSVGKNKKSNRPTEAASVERAGARRKADKRADGPEAEARLAIGQGMAGRAGLRSVVLAVDGSPHARRAAAFAARLAPPPGGRVTVVSVVEPMRAPTMALLPSSTRGLVARAAADLERAPARCRPPPRRGRRPHGGARAAGGRRPSVRTGVPLAEILRAVEEAHADLLVLGARGNERARPHPPRQRGRRGAPPRACSRPRREVADLLRPIPSQSSPSLRLDPRGGGGVARAPRPDSRAPLAPRFALGRPPIRGRIPPVFAPATAPRRPGIEIAPATSRTRHSIDREERRGHERTGRAVRLRRRASSACSCSPRCVWGLVGMLVGLVIALQLANPMFNFGLPWLSFGRLRPLHTNAVIFAFAGNAIFAGVYYSTQRLLQGAHVERRAEPPALLGLAGHHRRRRHHAAARLSRQVKEYAELEWPIDIAIAVVWVVFAVNFFGTARAAARAAPVRRALVLHRHHRHHRRAAHLQQPRRRGRPVQELLDLRRRAGRVHAVVVRPQRRGLLPDHAVPRA